MAVQHKGCVGKADSDENEKMIAVHSAESSCYGLLPSRIGKSLPLAPCSMLRSANSSSMR